MADLELIIATFDDESKAVAVLESVKQLKKEQYIEVSQAAVVVKRADGEIVVHDIQDVDSKSGKKFGAVAGGLIGLLGGGPIGAAIGAAAGAATGKIAADKLNLGIPEKELVQIKDRLRPSSSAIITHARIPFLSIALRRLEDLGAEVVHHTIDTDTLFPDAYMPASHD